METPPPPFDVCILCALPEEAQAVLEEFSTRCSVSFTRAFSRMDRYVYHYATIHNAQGEPLTVLVTWLSKSGPVQTGLDLKPLLHEFSPRFVAMTGFCAGYQQKVTLGDLVVAESAYFYEGGKVIKQRGGSIHQPEMAMADPTSQVLHYVRGFNNWKEPIRAMKQRQLNRQLEPNEEPRCVVGPMASGMAVRADDPFPWLRERYDRNTVGLDMEAATFYQALRALPHIHALVVKGVCDYADMNKGDDYHEYAARASAIYLLAFLQAHVNEQTMPRRDGLSSSSRAAPPSLWRVPHARNPHFTGRESILQSLRQALVPGAKVTALTQAISGLGGIGKTQVAAEYAHRYANTYTAVFWAQADAVETITTEYLALAMVLGLPDQIEAAKQMDAVKHWLQTNHGWLLILDNVEEPEHILPAFLPSKHQGSVLITTRRRDVRVFARSEVLPVFEEDEGTLFLLRRAGLLVLEAPITSATQRDYHLAKELGELLGWLPLAVDQAGAYIMEQGCSLERYIDLYQQARPALLDRRGVADHPSSVLATFKLSWEAIQQRNALAGNILQFCAFLAPDQISEALIRAGLGHAEMLTATETLKMDEALGLLHRYSLIERTDQALSLHRLVQEVIREVFSEEERQKWMERAMLGVNAIFPTGEHGTWSLCEFLLPQAFTCVQWMESLRRKLPEGGRLCGAMGRYLYERAQYTAAEPLLRLATLIYEQQLGPEHPDTVANFNNLALLYLVQGNYELAEPLLQRALSIREQQLGPEHPITASNLSNLAEIYRVQGRYELAEPLLQRALSIREQQLGPANSDTAASLNNLAALYHDQGRYELAEPLLQRALSICEQQLGPEHPHMATSLSNLALLHLAQGRHEQAAPLLQRALSIAEPQLGLTHPGTARNLNNLARFYLAQGEHEQAESLLRRALSIREQQLGPEHPDVADTLNNLAEIYRVQGRYELAEPLLQRALSICEQQLGSAHPHTAATLNNFALLYLTQKMHEQAEPLLQRTLSICEQQLGLAHPHTATILSNLAALYLAQGRYELAEPLLQRALSICEQMLGPKHPDTARSLNNLAMLYRDQSKYEQAKPLLQRAVEICVASLGMDHPQTQQMMTSYHKLLSEI